MFLFNNCFVFVRVFLTLGLIKGIYIEMIIKSLDLYDMLLKLY